jgi:hypothetical protein
MGMEEMNSTPGDLRREQSHRAACYEYESKKAKAIGAGQRHREAVRALVREVGDSIYATVDRRDMEEIYDDFFFDADQTDLVMDFAADYAVTAEVARRALSWACQLFDRSLDIE